jgi:hypothetical protein
MMLMLPATGTGMSNSLEAPLALVVTTESTSQRQDLPARMPPVCN